MANERITEDIVRNHFKNDPLKNYGNYLIPLNYYQPQNIKYLLRIQGKKYFCSLKH